MAITRRDFIKNSTIAAVVTGVARHGFGADFNLPTSETYDAMRKQLRAFYPDECRGAVKDARQIESVKRIEKEVFEYAKAHSDYDALDIRRATYKSMIANFEPFLFTESPFYFEAGVNGGWSGKRPAQIVSKLCAKFYRSKNLVPNSAFKLLRERHKERLALCCGAFVDNMHHIPPLRTILQKGFGGVRAEVAKAIEECPKDDHSGRKELETALAGLDTIHEIQLAFAKEAQKRLANENLSPTARKNFARIAESAKRCPWEPPSTFYEGLNTLWFVREILGYIDDVWIFALGRPDCWLNNLYEADLVAGRLTKAEAADLIARFLLIAECHHDGMIPVKGYEDHEVEIPMSLGGCDKFGKPVYNDLTKMFLEMHYRVDCVFPKLHCRIASDSPQEYLLHIGDLIMRGHCVFALFNDDRHIPYFLERGISLEDAREYIGTGCWDGLIDSVMDVDTANYVSLMRPFELTIHRDLAVEKAVKIDITPIDNASSTGEVRKIAYMNFIKFFRNVMSEYTRYGRSRSQVSPHPVYTMCIRGGIQSRRDTTDCGIPERPRLITLAFLGNMIDSILAIDYVCFDKKICTLPEFLNAVRSNWAGEHGEVLRKVALEAPYWGDGSKKSCGEMRWWMQNIYDDIQGFKTDQDNDYHLATLVYREFMFWGEKAKATPDGRRAGDYFAQGFSPSEYRCKEGITTVLNSIATLPHECFIASNANLTFDKKVMSAETFAAVFRVFAKKCGHLLQPNCNSVDELLDAQKHPERYKNLMVKFCGFSARFVAMSKRFQDEVIARHRLV